MTDIADAFLFLTGFGSTSDALELRTREISTKLPAGPILVGVDASDGRHLLLPVGEDQIEEDLRSKHVVVKARDYGVAGSPTRFVDLHCRTANLGRLFEQLAQDVLLRIEAGAEVTRVCQQTLDDWRYLLERQRGDLGMEEVLGLHGELYVLQLMARSSPARAVEVWEGPFRKPQDFLNHGRALEIKTTQNVDASQVRVSNATQLDPTGLESLDLLVLRVREDERGPTLDERVEAVLESGVPRIQLLERLREAHYEYGTAQSTERVVIHECFHWRVDDEFPSLRATDIDPRRRTSITEISYSLSLPGPPDHVGEAAVASFLTEWVLPPSPLGD